MKLHYVFSMAGRSENDNEIIEENQRLVEKIKDKY